MATSVSGCLMPCTQGDGTSKLEIRASILSSEELQDIKFEVIADYNSEESDQSEESKVHDEK